MGFCERVALTPPRLASLPSIPWRVAHCNAFFAMRASPGVCAHASPLAFSKHEHRWLLRLGAANRDHLPLAMPA